jgi:hypothetical protein
MPADEFESYLRSFQPLAPSPLPPPARRWPYWLAGPLAAAACWALWWSSARPAPPPEHLTIGAAHELLLQEEQWTRALDANAFAKPSGPASPLENLNMKERP